MTAREHARLLGLFFWIYVGYQIVMTAFSGIMMFVMSGVMMSEFSKMPRRANEPSPEGFLGMMFGIMIFAVIIVIIFMIPKVIAGYGLRNDRSWAKIWAIVACCLAVLSIPFGTALGVYGFWFIFGDAGKNYFDNPNGFSQMPPPPPNSWQ